MSLIDLVPVGYAIAAGAFAILVLLLLRRAGLFRTLLDPSIVVFFQLTFTAMLLLALSLMPFTDALCFAAMVLLIVVLDRVPWRRRVWISETEWLEFSRVVIVLALAMNMWLLATKGFVFFAEDAGTARLDFYQGWGIFKRMNECAAAIIAISGYYLFGRGLRAKGIFYTAFSGFLLLTLGSMSGLITLLLLFGAYSHFYRPKVSAWKLGAASVVVVTSSLLLFYVIYRDQFLLQFGVRVVSFCDGPFYYYQGRLLQSISYPLDYVLDQVLVAMRIVPEPRYLGLGRTINWLYFSVDTPLTGPNPQVFVTARVLFGPLYPLGYMIAGLLFVFSRKCAATPFSFYLACTFAGPLLVDAPYAFSELFTVALCLGLFVAFRSTRTVLRWATFNPDCVAASGANS